MSLVVDNRTRAVTVKAAGARHVVPYDHVDLLWTGSAPKTGEPICVTLLQDLVVPSIESPDRLTVLVLPEEARALALAANQGK